ncbi:MAG: hypothetical protein QXK76_03615 [Candidatus Woesearchaeota archaeon]
MQEPLITSLGVVKMITKLQYTIIFTLVSGIIFGVLFWLQIYMETYRHFPKMEKKKRIIMSIISATIATAILLTGVILLMIWLVDMVI